MTRRYGGDVDESSVALIRLPDDRLAHLHTSFGEEPTSALTVFADEGSALLHSKTMVIDGVWATIGSTNLDNRSFAVNDELNVIVYNRGIAQRLEVFSDDIAHSRRVTLKEWKRRGLTARLLETLALPIRDLL